VCLRVLLCNDSAGYGADWHFLFRSFVRHSICIFIELQFTNNVRKMLIICAHLMHNTTDICVYL
jgi:hypothetical protein